VLADVGKYPARQVCVTGGEPLSQKDCLPLLTALCDAGYEVSLETSGRLTWLMSIRGSRESWI
jgi:7-carboxy-7-deazaguanine synthase